MNLKTEILNRYRGYIMLNKNVFIAGVCAFMVSMLVAEAYYYTMGSSAALNSTLSVAVEYGVYIPLFTYLYYRDNRNRYRDGPSILWRSVFSDARKLVTTLSIAELVYVAVRGYMHYHLLTMGMQPYQAALISSILASMLFYAVVNIGARVSGLFN